MILKGYRDEELADLVNVDRSTISRLRRGENPPTWPVMTRIRLISGGQVSPNDFEPVEATDDSSPCA